MRDVRNLSRTAGYLRRNRATKALVIAPTKEMRMEYVRMAERMEHLTPRIVTTSPWSRNKDSGVVLNVFTCQRHTRRPTNRCTSPSVRAKFSERGIIQVAFCDVPNVHDDNELHKKEFYKQGR